MEDPERLLREATEGDPGAARDLLALAMRKDNKPLAITTTSIIMKHLLEWLGVLKETGSAYQIASQFTRWVQHEGLWHIAYPGILTRCKGAILDASKGQLKAPQDQEKFCKQCVWNLEKTLYQFSTVVDLWATSETPREKRAQARKFLTEP